MKQTSLVTIVATMLSLSRSLSLSLSPHSAWKMVHGSVLTLRSPFALPVMPSSTWQRANNISSEFCLPTSTETVSHQSQVQLLRPCSSKVCLCLHGVTRIYFPHQVEWIHTEAAVVFYDYVYEMSSGVPSAPGQVIATRESDTSVLIQWAPPKEPNNLIGYYIDQCVKGSKDWDSANHKPRKNTKYVFQPINNRLYCTEMLLCLILWLLMDFTCYGFVCAGLWLAVWPKEKPTCSVSRLSMR